MDSYSDSAAGYRLQFKDIFSADYANAQSIMDGLDAGSITRDSAIKGIVESTGKPWAVVEKDYDTAMQLHGIASALAGAELAAYGVVPGKGTQVLKPDVGKWDSGQKIVKNHDGLHEVKISATPLEGQARLNTVDAMGNGKLNPAEAAAAARMENVLGKMERLPDTSVAGKNADFVITNGPNKGKTVDLMYTTKNLSQKEIDGINKFYEKNMTVASSPGKLPPGKDQIIKHLDKADIVPVDFSTLTTKN
ncbi:MAG: hypothetical protein ACTH5V_11410 [Serratia proteamaculans]